MNSDFQASAKAQSARRSLPPTYFERLYADNPDPWQFETSEYEAKKYAATLAALPRPRYQAAFEIGGSIGVLTELLSDRCESLLSVDVSAQAQARARARCQHRPHVEFAVMQVPHEFPDRTFDLIIVSEVGYYWGWDDFPAAQQRIADQLAPGGHLLLVHWTPQTREYPLTGDEVHTEFWAQVGTVYRSLVSQREQRYRLDLFERL